MHFAPLRLALLLVSILGLAACKRNTAPQISGAYVSMADVPLYRLRNGAAQVELTKPRVDRHLRLFNHHPYINQPLARMAEGPNYQVYLGLVVEERPGTNKLVMEADSIWRPLEIRKAKGGTLGLYAAADSLYNVRYLGPNKRTRQMHITNLATPDSALARQYYNSDSLFNGDYLL